MKRKPQHLKCLNKNNLPAEDQQAIADYPIKVLQIGEGHFLRGFFDWMIHECNKKGYFNGSIAVTQPRPQGKTKIEKLKQQDGLYTLLIRGLQNKKVVNEKETISVFSRIIDPYTEWGEFLALAKSPDLEFVVSNTTEAGLSYQQMPLEEGVPMTSFPGRLTIFLYQRYLHFNGDSDKGLIMLPCELLEENGDKLKQYVVQHSKDWELSTAFINWLEQDNLFLNSLVDRIVTGYPVMEAEKWTAESGYVDQLLNTTEPYYFWAIEADPSLDRLLPLNKAGLNVHWVEDLTPYQIRKVRILNGSHTIIAPLGILYGLDHVGQVMADSEFKGFLQKTIEEDILPTLPYNRHDMMQYAESVLERFINPFVQHQLADILLNSISKFKVRLLPTLVAYFAKEEQLPASLVTAFAGLIRYYKVQKSEDNYVGTRFDGSEYIVKDDQLALDFFCEQWSSFEAKDMSLKQLVKKIIGNKLLWDKDLNRITGLSNAVCNNLKEIINRFKDR
ncbi:tagaturonate reductase [Scopulibacillus darangshiensis]|uniref:Tagaturonate reductase n=1 Tax=Scopulibacillus darangshiensis TaxID=442528 RepID=A0A4R2NIM4_9BACL|nr:tagaturonate reductase [Scopulibacillus darangshiensis]TCP21277.1 tagaturonate reductase [Scopulibacillus darangshiensis]